jgi:hypothetical protein
MLTTGELLRYKPRPRMDRPTRKRRLDTSSVSGTVDPGCVAGDEPLYLNSAVPDLEPDYLAPLVNRQDGDFTALIAMP